MTSGIDDSQQRKNEHIRICLDEDVNGKGITTGLEKYRFRHHALPEVDFEKISLSARFLSKPLAAPFLISSMTGGTERGARINRMLAEAAGRHGWALGVGSARTAIERPETAYSFHVRDLAPNIPIIANLGAVQLSYGYGVDQCRSVVEAAGADALVLHLNGMQELFQPGGNTNFAGLLRKIEAVCHALEVPVGVKEVGWGIDGETTKRLHEAGAAFIDVAGAGGTSWSEVERLRIQDHVRRAAAGAFANWGNPTAECVIEVRDALPDACIVASGGLKSGVDAAKALALGADVAGFGRALLAAADERTEDRLDQLLSTAEFELRTVLFGIGAASLKELRGTAALVKLSG